MQKNSLWTAPTSFLTPPPSKAELEVAELRRELERIVGELVSSPAHAYHSIPTVAYGLSKLGVNVYTQVASLRTAPYCKSL